MASTACPTQRAPTQVHEELQLKQLLLRERGQLCAVWQQAQLSWAKPGRGEQTLLTAAIGVVASQKTVELRQDQAHLHTPAQDQHNKPLL